MVSGGGVTYYHSNHLYSVAALTDDTGVVLERYGYGPYGDSVVYDASGSVIAESTVGNPYRFTGRRLDGETGLWYFRARYFDSELGRFIGRDPLGYVDGYSMYGGYFAVNGLDPHGLYTGPSPVKYPCGTGGCECEVIVRGYGVAGGLGRHHVLTITCSCDDGNSWTYHYELWKDGGWREDYFPLSDGSPSIIRRRPSFFGPPAGSSVVYHEIFDDCYVCECIEVFSRNYAADPRRPSSRSEYRAFGRNSNTFIVSVMRACVLRDFTLGYGGYGGGKVPWDDKEPRYPWDPWYDGPDPIPELPAPRELVEHDLPY